MKISIGADHRGFQLKSEIIIHFSEHTWLDVGANSADRTDYPIFARDVCKNIIAGKSTYGILLCGSGIGIAIAANRYKKIYAGTCWNEEIARIAKQDDGINVLVLPADLLSPHQAFSIITAWLSAEFKGGVYQKRLDMLENL